MTFVHPNATNEYTLCSSKFKNDYGPKINKETHFAAIVNFSLLLCAIFGLQLENFRALPPTGRWQREVEELFFQQDGYHTANPTSLGRPSKQQPGLFIYMQV